MTEKKVETVTLIAPNGQTVSVAESKKGRGSPTATASQRPPSRSTKK
jgi:hypothetical protein